MKDTVTITIQQTTKIPQKGRDGTQYPDIIESFTISGECDNTVDAINEAYMDINDKMFKAKINKSKVIKSKKANASVPLGKSIGRDSW